MSPDSTSSAEPLVLREDRQGVAWLTLNRPRQFNALSLALIEALEQALGAVAGDASVRVVVLAAAGKAFCAGHDLKELLVHRDRDFLQALFRRCSRMMTSIQKLPQPVIARVHGVATAAGCQLVAMCDLAVASEDATFAVSGINVGLLCSTPAVALSRNVGRKQALEMLLTGEFICARTALARGLVNRVVPREELDAEVVRLAAAILAKSPAVVAGGKRTFYAQLEMGIEAAYELASGVIACDMLTEDAAEGIAAFIQKRAPRWFP